jgi:hypothetical protein
MLTLLPLIFTTLGWAYVSYRSRKGGVAFVSPASIMMAGVIFLIGLAPLLHYNPIEITPELLWSIALFVVFACIGFELNPKDSYVSYILVPQPPENILRRAKMIAKITSIMLLFVAVTSLYGQMQEGYNIADLYRFEIFNEITAQKGSYVATWHAKIWDVGYKLSLFLFMMCAGPLVMDKSKGGKMWILVMNVTYLCALLSRYGGRQGVVAMGLLTVFVYFALVKSASTLKLAVAGAAAIFALFTLQLVRHYDWERFGNFSLTAIGESVGSGGEWERLECATDIIELRKSNPLTGVQRMDMIGELVYNFTVNWIPRVLWIDKPQTDWTFLTSGQIYGEQYAETNWVRNFTVLGQGYYLGNEIGVAIIGFLYALCTTYALRLCRNRAEIIGFRGVITMYCLYSLGNNFTTYLFYIASFLLIGSLLVKLVYPSTKTVQIGVPMTPRGDKLQPA